MCGGLCQLWGCTCFWEKLAVHKLPLWANICFILPFTIGWKHPHSSDLWGSRFAFKWREQTSADYEKLFPRFTIICVRGHLPGNTLSNSSKTWGVNLLPFTIVWVVEQEAGYNAYVEHDEMAVISMSQSSFLSKMTVSWQRPMKERLSVEWLTKEDPWSRPVGWSRILKIALKNMIVDLLRNDMNRISEVWAWSVCVRWSSIRLANDFDH